ncbi:MAG: hypothetical protein KJ869_10365, partial [Candidatus Edwardsbacteria bacterium]|nr:hypothetical protein [Candidatus Edwardsbacteria bacterium]
MCENEFKKISLKKFLSTFIDEDKSETRFCFILGAGASKQSGIPTGGELAKKWMEEIEESCDNEELEIINKWKIEKNITKETLAEHYTEIYDKRFEVDPKLGYTELERLMEDKEPSCGYSFLSQVLTKTKHNVVITTNFDSLTEDALFIYTQMKPIVCGHESLANFATPLWKRPLIIKVHRDVFFAPKSSPEQTKAIDGGWTEKLKNIFQNFIPIVIGYGGNDGSLIGLLDKIDKIPGIYWCYRKDNEPNGKIKKLVSTLNGWFIPIDGFDEMMIQLNNVLGFGLLDEKVKEVSNKRIENYRKQIEDINKRAKNEETEDALKSIVLKTKRNWWHIQMEVDAVNDKNEKQRIYEKGLKEFPDSYELRGEYAIFLHQEQKDYDSAEQQYKKVLEHEPDNITILGAYAILLYNIRNKNDEAEKLIIKAMNIK